MTIPPLRRRKSDIPLIAQHLHRQLIERYALRAAPPLTAELCAYLQRFEWPGNVRELGNAIERALLLRQDVAIAPADVSVCSACRATRC
jgi:DNA-binding NtrC family response regulator